MKEVENNNNSEVIKGMLPDIFSDIISTLTSKDYSKFSGLKIDRRKPHTLRLFYFKNNMRVCFHIFQECGWEDAFPHPHNWWSEVFIIKGKYRHWVSEFTPLDQRPNPRRGFTHILSAGSSYSIDNPYVWHRVQPLEESMTIMVNTDTWDVKSEFSVTTQGKELVELKDDEKREILIKFYQELSGNFRSEMGIELNKIGGDQLFGDGGSLY